MSREEIYATLFLSASASGLRCSELFALKAEDVDCKARSIRVDESSDQRSKGKLGLCKNAAAYRTVLLYDPAGKEALRTLKQFIKKNRTPSGLIFHSTRATPLIETNILHDGLHPTLATLKLPKARLHAFCHGCVGSENSDPFYSGNSEPSGNSRKV
jgi:integrase